MAEEGADDVSFTRSVCSSAENAVPAVRSDNPRAVAKLKELAECSSSSSFQLTTHLYEMRQSMMFVKDAACFPLLCAQRNAL